MDRAGRHLPDPDLQFKQFTGQRSALLRCPGMETFTLADNESMDAETVDDSKSISFRDQLASKTSNQRVQFLKKDFFKSEQPIQDIDVPELCKTYPEFGDEIGRAYLRYTTFTLKVIVNYDGACKQFFGDARKQDCAKLVLNAKGKELLEGIRAQGLQFNRVRLELGTAFRNFSQILVRANPTTGEVTALHKPQTGEHPLLMKFLGNICTVLNRQALPEGQSGFTIENIEWVAGQFMRQDHKPLMEYRNGWAKEDEWSTIVSSGRGFHSNPGHLAYGSDLQKWTW